jgi:uncharacterized repeat protein (TIGR01451 family)
MKYHQTTKRLIVLVAVAMSLLIKYAGEAAAETTDKVISAVLLEQSLPSPVDVGKPFDCEIKVTNQTSRTVEEVVVTDKLSPVFKFISAVPEPQDVLSVVWTLPEVAFDSDSHEIKSEYRQSLEQAAQAIAANPDAQFTIEGHTDDVGEESYNLELSRKRADAVKTYLVNEFGMNASQISAIGFGEEQPLVDNDSENNRQKNRRVEIRLGGRQIQSDTLQWTLGTLGAGESKVIRVTGTASRTGQLTNNATVAYKTGVYSTISVIEPKLQLVKTAPDIVLICDSIPIKFVVSNPGSGSAYNVKIHDVLPEGLVTMDGKTEVRFDVGTLGAGESEEFAVNTKATRTGTYTNKAVATTDTGLTAEATTTTVVREPILALTNTGNKQRIINRNIKYNITLANTGDADAENTVLEDMAPSGTTFISATGGGQFAESEGKVVWNLGTLVPGISKEFSVVLRANQFGMLRSTASAGAVCAKPVSAVAVTEIVGIPAILLEAIDISDPIEVGQHATYEITATNQGSADGTNIQIVCTLEENVEYVSSSGSSDGILEGNTLTFAPYVRLAPKARATWNVVVKAVKAGDVRFKVSMTSDQLTREVEETEATTFYE